MRRSRKTVPRDILDVAAEQLGRPEPSILFDALLDAALRSLRPLPFDHPNRIDVLNVAMDRLYRELTEERGAGAGQGVSPQQSRAGVLVRVPRPALRP